LRGAGACAGALAAARLTARLAEAAMQTTMIALARRLALAGSALFLAGCAATQLDATVHTTGNWPVGRAPGSFAYERLPSQMAQPEEQDRLEAEALPALAKAGFKDVYHLTGGLAAWRGAGLPVEK